MAICRKQFKRNNRGLTQNLVKENRESLNGNCSINNLNPKNIYIILFIY